VKELTLHNVLIIVAFASAAVVFIALFFVVAPYGRHVRKGWGFSINNKLAWVLMEAASPIIFFACFLTGNLKINGPIIAFLVLYLAHYIHRAFIYPFSLRGTEKRMPLSVVFMGMTFNFMNAYLNGRYIFWFSGDRYTNSWLTDPRFIAGVVLFLMGYIINRQADQALRDLRKDGSSGYKISYSRFYRLVSSPNYLGEITIWTGWAIATWSLAGLAFAVWTIANLLPRARANHLWYRSTFPDYPPERKALIPRIW
jgi:3-oxo-5-alpha-steroid 4-dehydrogenase 1